MDITLFFVLLLFLALAVGAVLWLGYWGPRSRAFKSGQRVVPVWFGAGRLLLWNPGETFVFQANKKLRDVGDPEGLFPTDRKNRTHSWEGLDERHRCVERLGSSSH
jgi:hypothetical protein